MRSSGPRIFSLLAALALLPQLHDGLPPLPKQPGNDWMLTAQKDIALREYHASWSERVAAYQAPNRAQNLRTYFTPEGTRLVSRTEKSPSWSVNLGLEAIGRGETRTALAEPRIATHGNRVEYLRPGLVEWYVNDAKGLEQGFRIEDPVAGEGELVLRLGSLANAGQRGERAEPRLAGDGAVEFFTGSGARVLRYAELHAFANDGRELQSRLLVKDGAVELRVAADNADFPLTIDPLATSPSWTAEGDQASAQFGFSVSAAGDVNGDGYADVVVGAFNYDNGETDEGRAFLYPGSASGLTTTAAWTAESDQAGAHFGNSVASAGDVNGDGYADVVVGAPDYDNGETDEGRAFLYLGNASGLAVTPAWTAESDQASAHFGYSVASAGDVNGDGYADVVVGTDEGGAYVYHGSASGLATTAAWTAAGDPGTLFGRSVAAAGDVNGDGYGDVIVGAPRHTGDALDEGAAFVYHGSATGLAASAAWTALSGQQGAFFGASVSSAGDVNGDGYADVIVGAWGYENGQTNEGRAYVYHGSASGLAATAAWTAESDQLNAQFGFSASSAGDVNGDGYADVIVGANRYDNGQANEGKAFVYQGSASGLATAEAWTAESDQVNAQFGVSVSAAGDVNGDGYADVIVGANLYDNGETDEGRAFLYQGSASGLTTSAAWTAESDQASAHFGNSVSSAGDVNGDGYADVVVGAPDYDNGETDEGRAFLYLGNASGLAATAAWTAESDQASAHFGYSVASAGDVNGDGYGDVLVGTDEGGAYVYHGSASGLATTAAWTAAGDPATLFGRSVAAAGDVNGDGYGDVIVGAPRHTVNALDEGAAFVYHGSATGLAASAAWTALSGQQGAFFGASVSPAGDVNGDGYADVVVGAWGFDNGETDEGRAYVYHGGALGLATTAAWTAESNQGLAQFGFSVSSAGDVNGDGYADVIVGANRYDNGQANEGKAFVYQGSASGLATAEAWTAESDQVNAQFGVSVSPAGDVNGDGYADVIVGASLFNNGETDEGRAFLYQGGATGLTTTAAWTAEGGQASAHFGSSVSPAGDVNGDGYGDVVVGAPDYDSGETDEGRALLYLGNSAGRPVRAQQKQGGGSSSLVQGWGLSQNADSFRASVNATSPTGRVRVRLQVQACPPGAALGHASCTTSAQSSWADVTATSGGTPLVHEVTGLSAGTTYHWRARVLYAPYTVTESGITAPPNPAAGPWRRLEAQAGVADIRVGALPVVVNPTSASVNAMTATLGGEVTSDGGAAITSRGVVYAPTATNANPEIGGTGALLASTTGTTGVFTVDVTGLSPATAYSFKAYVTNAVATSYTTVATFTTAATPVCSTISLAGLPNGIVGTAYSGSATASGGISPYTYAVTSGSLPSGLSLTASGTGAGSVAGTPSAAGTFAFEITATDANTCTGAQSYSVLIGSMIAAGDLVIREFRSRGPAGEHDEYVEITNRSSAALTLAATDGSAGLGIAASSVGSCPGGAPALLATIPNGTVIPAGGSFLAANDTATTGYSLADYGGTGLATPDATWTDDLCYDSGIGLFRSTGAFDVSTRLDAVGFSGSADPYKEGAGLLPANGIAADGEWVFLRKAPYPTGMLKDTGDNAADFLFVSTNAAVYSSVQSALGSPGPQNLASPRLVTLPVSLADPAVGVNAAPNRVQSGNYHYFRRKITNDTGAPITKLRYRVMDLSTLYGVGYNPGVQADLRGIATADVVITLSDATTPTAKGLTLEAPTIPYPTFLKGGGYNASFVVDLTDIGGSLADGASLYLNVGFRSVKGGSGFFLLLPEVLN